MPDFGLTYEACMIRKKYGVFSPSLQFTMYEYFTIMSSISMQILWQVSDAMKVSFAVVFMSL